MFRYIFFLCTIFLVLACTTRPKVPREFPNEKEMAELLADIYIAEGTINNSGYYHGKSDNKIPGYYRFVLDKHRLTKQEFDTIVSWYTAHPKLFKEVYEDVISILSEQEAQLASDLSKIDNEAEMIPRLAMEKDLWTGRRYYKLPLSEKDSIDARIPFTIAIDSLQGGMYSIQANYRFQKENVLEEAKLRMIACYADSTRDTIDSKINKSFKGAIGSKSYNAQVDKKLVSIEGLLFDHDTAKVAEVEIRGVKLNYLPPMEELNK